MQSIAVIGLSCLFPEANTPAEYWQNLLQGKNSCTSATEPILEAEPSRFYANKKGVVTSMILDWMRMVSYCQQKESKNLVNLFNGLFMLPEKHCVTAVIMKILKF